VQDITNTLVSDYELNDVLRIILETMYRGIGFARVLLCVSDPRQTMLRARFGFGTTPTPWYAAIRHPLAAQRDVFYAAVTQGADICIEDIDAETISKYIRPGIARPSGPGAWSCFQSCSRSVRWR